MGKMMSNDEIAVVAAILKTLGITEVTLSRETLLDAYSGKLYVEDNFDTGGWKIRVVE
jgi:hypothetical protein